MDAFSYIAKLLAFDYLSVTLSENSGLNHTYNYGRLSRQVNPKKTKKRKKFLAVIVGIQRLTTNRLGPFCATAWNSTTYANKKAPPFGGASW